MVAARRGAAVRWQSQTEEEEEEEVQQVVKEKMFTIDCATVNKESAEWSPESDGAEYGKKEGLIFF